MGFKKAKEDLEKLSYVDERGLICYSYANYTHSSNYIFVMTLETVRQNYLPKFMLLSICDDKLHISKAGRWGGFKGYFGFLELKKLNFVKEFHKDFMYTYEFIYDVGDGKTMSFLINALGLQNGRVVDVVNVIKGYK